MAGGRNHKSKAVTVGTLAKMLSANYGVSERMAFNLLRESLDMITSALVDGQRVHLVGFGTFTLRNRAAQEAIQTPYGVVNVPERSRAYYNPAKWLKSLPAQNGPSPMDECPL